MTHHERTTIADRCARCDASTGAPDAQALLAEARAQLEEARRERDEARQSSEYLHVRWTETAARADGLEEQLADARRERDVARDWERAARETASLLGDVLGRYTTQRRCRLAALLWRSARSRRLRERLHDAEVAAEQGVLVARDLEERLRAERAAGMELRASLVEAATFARGVVGKCDCLTCAPSQQLAERWERQARGTEVGHG